jgi:cytochrome o ubiquinol oxidase subunit IV
MTIQKYTTGFIACLLLTGAAFAIVSEHLATRHQFLSHGVLFAGILALAVLQLFVQLRYFLHLGPESRWRDLVMFALALALIVIIVGGSLWIMANLTHSDAVPFYNSSVTPQNSTD